MRAATPWLALGAAALLSAAWVHADKPAAKPADPVRPVAVTVDAAADEETTARVQTGLLEDPLVKGFRIEVDTRDGIVYLTGVVGSEQEKAQSIRIARATHGVRGVEAKLTVG